MIHLKLQTNSLNSCSKTFEFAKLSITVLSVYFRISSWLIALGLLYQQSTFLLVRQPVLEMTFFIFVTFYYLKAINLHVNLFSQKKNLDILQEFIFPDEYSHTSHGDIFMWIINTQVFFGNLLWQIDLFIRLLAQHFWQSFG